MSHRTIVTALPRDQDEIDAGWVYFFECDCGVVGSACSSLDEATEEAREHRPELMPAFDVPPEAKPDP